MFLFGFDFFGVLQFGLDLKKIFEFIGRTQEKRRRFSVAGDQLSNGAHLG